MNMKRTALIASTTSLLLLGIALVAIFSLTSLDLESASEVASIAPESKDTAAEPVVDDEGSDVDDEATAPTSNVVATESVNHETPEPKTPPAPQDEAQPLEEADHSRSLIVASPFTGDVEVDFPASDPDVTIIEDAGGVDIPLFDATLTSGWEIRDIRFKYDSGLDEFLVGLNFLAVGGDPEGDGNPATGALLDGADRAAWGGTETFVLVLDLTGDGQGDLIAGLPFQQDISGFSVNDALPGATFNPVFSFGSPRPELVGILPVDTSDTSPDIEFSIAGFSSISSPDVESIGALAFAGSIDDGGIGEEFVSGVGQVTEIPNPVFVPSEPELTIEKSTNGVDADTADTAPQLAVGSTATFEYIVTNTGQLDLVELVVTDDILGDVCTIASLAVGASASCEATATVVAGDYVNIGSASGFEDDGLGNPTGDPVTDTDPSNHRGVAPGIRLTKSLDGRDLDNPDEDFLPLPTFAVGTTITFDFLVANNGDFDLVDIALVDDVLGPINCPQMTLLVGESMTCTGDHVVVAGVAQRNVGTVTAQPIDAGGEHVGDPIGSEDPAHHSGAATSITIEKATNGIDADDATGPEVNAGDIVTFTYVVTNNGPATVQDLVVTDDIEGPVCTIDVLSPGESSDCALETTAGVGQYVNVGTVVGDAVDAEGNVIDAGLTASDPSHHVGVCVDSHDGPVLYRGARTIWNTNLVAGDDSTIVLTTSENGDSPGQPNEQVYIEVAGVLYGPSPAGLGTIALDIAEGGQVRVLHISEVEDGLYSANSVVPSLCGDDLEEIVPVCTDLVGGPALYAGARTEWMTGLIAQDDSTIRVNTSENGASPGQPNEQVFLQIGDDIYGPTFAGLGDIEFDIENGGPVTVLHYSEVTNDRSSANSVVPAICGDALAPAPGPACPDVVSGPRLFQGGDTMWNSGFTAAAGSEITIVTFDDVSDFRQPHEQVYVRVGEMVYGPTPADFGELTFVAATAGPVTVLHYSEINGLQTSANSVEFTLCGDGLTETVQNYLDSHSR